MKCQTCSAPGSSRSRQEGLREYWPQVFRSLPLANLFRRENADVVGDKPVKNDAGEVNERRLKAECLVKALPKASQRWVWDRDHLSYQPPVEGPPIPITIDMVKKAISQMKAGKAPGPSSIVVEMIWAAGDNGASMIRDLAAAIIRDGKVPSDWEQSFIVCLYKGKWDALERGSDRGLKLTEEVMKVLERIVGGLMMVLCVNWRFPVWLCPRQRHNRCNLCCQAAVREVSSCQQETLHGFRRPG